MISFTPTEDEQALLDTCARFAEQVLTPQTREADRENAINDRVRQQYREMGMHLLGLPEEYGGSEFGLIAKVLAEEALARVDAAQAVALDEAGFAAQAVLLLGTDAQKQQWLAPFAQDAAYALALAADERDPAANLGYLQTRAEPAGEDHRLSGEKLAVYNAERARHFIVLARVQEGEGLAGVAAFVVDARDPGVTIEFEDRMGLRAARACRVGFSDAKAQRLGGDSEISLACSACTPSSVRSMRRAWSAPRVARTILRSTTRKIARLLASPSVRIRVWPSSWLIWKLPWKRHAI